MRVILIDRPEGRVSPAKGQGGVTRECRKRARTSGEGVVGRGSSHVCN